MDVPRDPEERGFVRLELSAKPQNYLKYLAPLASGRDAQPPFSNVYGTNTTLPVLLRSEINWWAFAASSSGKV